MEIVIICKVPIFSYASIFAIPQVRLL